MQCKVMELIVNIFKPVVYRYLKLYFILKRKIFLNKKESQILSALHILYSFEMIIACPTVPASYRSRWWQKGRMPKAVRRRYPRHPI